MRGMGAFAILIGVMGLFLAGCGGEPNAGGDGGSGTGGTGGTGGTDATGGTGGGDGGAGGEGGVGGGSGKARVDELDPSQAGPGFRIRVIGENLHPSGPMNRIYFVNAEGATTPSIESVGVSAGEGNWFEADVPTNAKSGPTLISVDTPNGRISVQGPDFKVTDEKLRPEVTGVAPLSITTGPRTVVVTINGRGFYPNLTTLTLNSDDFPIDWTKSDAKKLVLSLPAVHVTEPGILTLVITTPAPGGGTATPIQIRVVEPINVVSAKALSNDRVLVTFDRPVASASGNSASSFGLVGVSRSIRSAAVVKGKTNRVDVVLRNNTTANRDYTMRVSDKFLSADGGEIQARDATFRSFGSHPIFLKEVGAQGCGNGAFSHPSGVVLRGDSLYVTERTGNQIQELDREGNFLGFYGHDGTGFGFHEAGNAAGCGATPQAAGALSGPVGVTYLTSDFRLLVGDTQNDRVMRLDSDGGDPFMIDFDAPVVLGYLQGRGIVVADGPGNAFAIGVENKIITQRFGRADFAPGNGRGELDLDMSRGGTPAMAVAPDNFIYFVEPGNHRVQKFTSSFTQVGSIGNGSTSFVTGEAKNGAGTARGHFTDPSGIAIDASNTLYVVDAAGGTGGGGRLQAFTNGGTSVWQMQLNYIPGGVAVDDENQVIWVTNRSRHSLMQYSMP